MFDELAAAGVFSLRADGFSWADCDVVFEQLGRCCVPGPLVGCRSWRGDGGSPASSSRPNRCGSSTSTLLDVSSCIDGATRAHVDPRALDAEPSPWPLDPITPIARVDTLPTGALAADADCGDMAHARARCSPPRSRSASPTASPRWRSAYAKERVQFDRPIASFQAIKHLCADMLDAHRSRPGGGLRGRRAPRRSRPRRARSQRSRPRR